MSCSGIMTGSESRREKNDKANDRDYFTVRFPLGLVVVETGSGGNISGVFFDLEGRVTESESSSDEARALERYLAGERISLDFDLDLDGSPPFYRLAWDAVRRVPYGRVETYGGIAAVLGRYNAARAVGCAMARNRFPLIIPCHRVVAKGGIGGFSPGVKVKRWLLGLEGIH